MTTIYESMRAVELLKKKLESDRESLKTKLFEVFTKINDDNYTQVIDKQVFNNVNRILDLFTVSGKLEMRFDKILEEMDRVDEEY